MNNNEYAIKSIINGLQNILKHERKHFNFYLQALMEIRGPESLYLKSLLEKEMNGELSHIIMFGNKIVSLGARPTTESHPFSFGDNPSCKEILKNAISMERQILKIYHDLYSESERFGETFNDMSISLLLEENIEDTTADVEEMEKVLSSTILS